MNNNNHLELSAKADKNRKKIQALIVGCVNCQTYDKGEIIWINGEEKELVEMFNDFDVPEEQWQSIADNLACGNCGSSDFEVYSDVGMKSKFDIALDKYLEQTFKKYGQIIQEFDNLLEKVPLLAYTHRFGKQIYKDLKESNFPTTSVNGVFYRARRLSDGEILTKERMMNPPTGKPHEGRYNHSGQSHLYLSSNSETAIEEVMGIENKGIVWILELKLERVDKILDLSFDWTMTTPETSPVFFILCGHNFINRSDRNKELWKPDYFLTRYVADCAKHLGYNGVKYNSVRKSCIDNLVLFYPENCVIEIEEEPRLETYKGKEEGNRRREIDI